ncbi:MAG TPA: tRNA (N(6)-L-threonylcarbamoyladenosine(37)-C(2))-methylthiotransferase MtaB [Rikenellaceae bacterium]|nr:tRNA (N(6)-L-threonylcarbamoyladenosine(37)-C(2))-methylthiotransferase MtaB [Rikenellaceae bacterium]
MTIAFLTLGCKLNYAETSTYERGFAANGLTVVPWEDKADVYLINTCSVTERAEKKCRNVIRKMHRTSPEARIIVTGCYAELRRKDLQAIDGVTLVFGAKEKSRVVPETMALLRKKDAASEPSRSVAEPVEATVSDAITDLRQAQGPKDRKPMSAAEYKEISKETMAAFSSEERTRSFLKVQDGCNNFCAYCTVPYARGNSRNIPISEVLEQARKIAESGIKEIVITGVNTGDFGRSTGESFLDLLKRLNDVEGIERYRISSIEPNLITEDIIDWIASGTKFQPHFHIPLQSGSDTILKRIGRRYTTEFFADRIDYIRSVMDPRPEDSTKPFVFFGIDVIAGLPGETDELFEETYSFLKDRIRPAFIHVFPYSRRPGTVAAGWKDQVKDSLKTERVARLESLCSELHSEFVAKNRGRRSQVLWESDVKDGLMGGYTSNYIRVERPYDPGLVNMVEDITI